MNCVAVSSARCRWGGCCAWAAISAAASCFQWSVTGWGKLFPVQSSLVLGSSSSVEAFKHPPPPTLGPVVFALLLPATWGRVQREETPTEHRDGGEERKVLLGFAPELSLRFDSSIIQSCFSSKKTFTSIHPSAGAKLLAPVNPNRTQKKWLNEAGANTGHQHPGAARRSRMDLTSSLLFHVSSEVVLHSAAVMFTPSTVHHSPQGRRMSVDCSVSTVNRTPVWHKSRQQQCGCCMATKSLTRLCSICRMTRALLSPFLSHFPIYCPASPSLP